MSRGELGYRTWLADCSNQDRVAHKVTTMTDLVKKKNDGQELGDDTQIATAVRAALTWDGFVPDGEIARPQLREAEE